jgi:hypothetical protein
MNINFLAIVKRIVSEQGESILAEPQRLKGRISDYAKDQPKAERLAFGRCIEYGAYEELKNAPIGNRAAVKNRLAQKLYSEEGLDIAFCEGALDLLEAVMFGLPESKILCRNCGEEMQAGWKVCPYCGAQSAISAASAVPLVEPSPPLVPPVQPKPLPAAAKVLVTGQTVDKKPSIKELIVGRWNKKTLLVMLLGIIGFLFIAYLERWAGFHYIGDIPKSNSSFAVFIPYLMKCLTVMLIAGFFGYLPAYITSVFMGFALIYFENKISYPIWAIWANSPWGYFPANCFSLSYIPFETDPTSRFPLDFTLLGYPFSQVRFFYAWIVFPLVISSLPLFGIKITEGKLPIKGAIIYLGINLAGFTFVHEKLLGLYISSHVMRWFNELLYLIIPLLILKLIASYYAKKRSNP